MGRVINMEIPKINIENATDFIKMFLVVFVVALIVIKLALLAVDVIL